MRAPATSISCRPVVVRDAARPRRPSSAEHQAPGRSATEALEAPSRPPCRQGCRPARRSRRRPALLSPSWRSPPSSSEMGVGLPGGGPLDLCRRRRRDADEPRSIPQETGNLQLGPRRCHQRRPDAQVGQAGSDRPQRATRWRPSRRRLAASPPPDEEASVVAVPVAAARMRTSPATGARPDIRAAAGRRSSPGPARRAPRPTCPPENGARSAARLAPSTIRSGPLPSSTSKLTVPLEAVRADATTAPRTTTSCASMASAASPLRSARGVGSAAVPSRRGATDTRNDSMPLLVDRTPATSSSWPRETLPASSPRRRRIAPLPSWMTADPASTVPDARVTTPRTVTRAFLAAARAFAIGTTGAIRSRGGRRGLPRRASRWPSETASESRLRAPRRRRPHAAARDIPTFRCRTNRAGRPRRSLARRHRSSSRQRRSRWRYRRRRGRRRSRRRRRMPGRRLSAVGLPSMVPSIRTSRRLERLVHGPGG